MKRRPWFVRGLACVSARTGEFLHCVRVRHATRQLRRAGADDGRTSLTRGAHSTRQASPNEVRERSECILGPIVVSELGGVVERIDVPGKKKNQAPKERERERELSETA